MYQRGGIYALVFGSILTSIKLTKVSVSSSILNSAFTSVASIAPSKLSTSLQPSKQTSVSTTTIIRSNKIININLRLSMT